MPFDFDAISTPFRMQRVLRRLAKGAAQPAPTQPRDRVPREQLAVLNSRAPQARLLSTGLDPQSARRARCEQAAAGHPEAWRRADVGWVLAPHLGWAAQHSPGHSR